ncbi:MAG: hypothetical protein P0Y56_03405 [Candidatus Andeanibacterium colombiense]|uniref:Hydrophobin n=1 Tax=Candidatus Andeanibacterium colombiense TaxID=3121345 RepID=A0AAJ5XAT4_9SPHN|nr:MAG: hypothetical protein P0Y56_03405 [Sphingomonadaceae bacterium]
MWNSKAITLTVVASLALTSPALAASKFRVATRSAQALPLRTIGTKITLPRTSPVIAPVTPVASTSPLISPFPTSVQASSSPFLTPSAVRPGRFGNGNFGGGLARLISFLPTPIKQIIAQALSNTPNGTQLCNALGLPNCQVPDSTG